MRAVICPCKPSLRVRVIDIKGDLLRGESAFTPAFFCAAAGIARHLSAFTNWLSSCAWRWCLPVFSGEVEAESEEDDDDDDDCKKGSMDEVCISNAA